jgi:hypothetical protein
LNLVGIVRFTARAAIDPNKGAAAGAADGKAAAEAVVGAVEAGATGTGIDAGTEQLANRTGM